MASLTVENSSERRATAFDASAAPTAVLDRNGVIVETNTAWRLFARLNSGADETTGVGASYLAVCDRERGADPVAERVADGLRAVLAGERTLFELEYPCHSPTEDRWYLLRASVAPVDGGVGVVVHHTDITARRLWEQGVVLDRSAGERRLRSLLRSGGQIPVHLLLVDFTGLAEIKERFGTPAAQDAIAHLTNRARRVLRSDDVFFRLSAYSLGMILRDLDPDAVKGIERRLSEVFGRPVQVGAVEATIAHSLGFTAGAAECGASELVERARSSLVKARPATIAATAKETSGPLRDEEPAGSLEPWTGAPVAWPHRPTTGARRVEVLLVEDSPGDASLIRSQLGSETTGEVRSTVAGSLAEALQQLDRGRFDCVLLNLELPDASDFEGLEAILAACPGMPVVVLTGWDDDDTARAAVRLGAQDCLCKSDLTAKQLNQSIGFAMERVRAELSERRLQVLMTRPSDLVMVVDPAGLLVYASPSIERVLGMAAHRAVGQPLEALVRHGDRDALAQALRAAAGRTAQLVARLMHVDGSLRHGDITIEDWSTDPAISGLVVSVRDVTARVDAIEELQLEKAARDATVAQSLDMAMFFRPDGEIVWASPASRALFGLEPEDLIGRNSVEMIHPDDREHVLSRFMEMPGLGDHILVEFRVIDARGRIRWIEAAATNLVDDPLVGVVVGNLRDVSARKSAEQESNFKRVLLDAVGQSVIATDLQGRVSYWNHAAEVLFGWAAAEAIGRPAAELLPLGDSGPAQFEALQTIRSKNETARAELVLRHRSGEPIPVEVTKSPVYADGVRVGSVTVSSDLSERRKAAAAMALLAAVVETSGDAIYSKDLSGNISTWNRGAEELFGYEESQIIGRHVSCLYPEDLADQSEQILSAALAGETVKMDDTRRVTADGRELQVSITVSPLRDQDGSLLGSSVIARDITERAELLRRVAEDRRRLEDAQRSAHLGSFEIDMVTGEVERSDEVYRIIGLGPDDVKSGVDFDFVHPEDAEGVQELLAAAVAGERDLALTHRIVRPDGEIRWVVTRSSMFEDPEGRVLWGTVLDITELHEARGELEQLAYYDALTGLANRTLLTSQLTEVLDAAAVAGTRTAVGLVDLDRFKVVNDRLGHGTGDAVLRAVAGRFSARLGERDLLGRFGGDEFVVLRPACDEAGARDLGTSLIEALAEPIMIDGRRFDMSASVGVVVVEPGGNAEDSLREADATMYLAKESGRSMSLLLDEEKRARVQRRLQIEAELGSAIERDQLRVVFQPVVELETGVTRGLEALLRWTHPELGHVGPDEFIPIAEQSGAIYAMFEWVLQRSLAQVAAWRLQPELSSLWVAVNLSGHQVAEADIVERISAALVAAGLPPEALHLEVTEGVLVDTARQGIGSLNSLQDLGVSIKLDDFGTGYSSLSYLKTLPVDSLKVDRSFIDGLGSDPDDTAIVAAILSMATTLGLSVVAEGVETADQLAALRALGCAEGQGYLWSPGVDSDEATRWLSEMLESERPQGEQAPGAGPRG
ncbi:MAG: PAS domain S-box protein [Acidimicrobiales bacterium]